MHETSPREDPDDHTQRVADVHSLKAPHPNSDIISVYTRAIAGHNKRKNIPEFNARCSWSDPFQLYLGIKILKCLTVSFALYDCCAAQPSCHHCNESPASKVPALICSPRTPGEVPVQTQVSLPTQLLSFQDRMSPLFIH